MFCGNCGQPLGTTDLACGNCGTKVIGGATPAAGPDAVAVAMGDVRDVARQVTRDPTGGLTKAFQQLGANRAFAVSLVFTAAFGLAASFAEEGISSQIPWATSAPKLPLFVGACVFPVAIAAVHFIARQAAQAGGPFSADLFVASVSVLPLAAVFLALRLLGLKNIEVLVVLGFTGFCMLVLLLFTGATRIANLSERGALFLVPLSILLAGWAVKIAVFAML